MFILNGGAVSWKSSKQDTIADSTTEAEYMVAAEAAKEGVWMKDFITELGVVPSVLGPQLGFFLVVLAAARRHAVVQSAGSTP